MLKALRVSSYRKRARNGKLNDIFVYEVTGTVSEIEAYKQAMLSAPNSPLTEANWAERGLSKNGKPLHWVVADLANGAIPFPTLNLTITQNNRIVVDNTIDKADKMIRMSGMVETFEAQAIVDIKLGLRKVDANAFTGQSSTAATPAAATPAVDENANEFGKDVNDIEHEMLENAAANKGTEALAD